MKGLIYKFLIQMRDTDNILKDWKYGIKSPIYKKRGIISDNYWTMTLMSTSKNIGCSEDK